MEDDNNNKREDNNSSTEPASMLEIRINDVPLDSIEEEKKEKEDLADNEQPEPESPTGASTPSGASSTSSSLSSLSSPRTPQLLHSPTHTQNTPLTNMSRLSVNSTPRTPQLSNNRYAIKEDKKTWGTILSENSVFLWLLCITVPLVYLVLMFGVIPIGSRDDDGDHDGDTSPTSHSNTRFFHFWVFTCVVSPINMTVISFLLCGIFLSCVGVMRPFRVHWSILLAVFVVQLIIFNLIVPFKGTFTLYGGATLLVSYFSTLAAIYCYETWKAKKICSTDNMEVQTELVVFRKLFWQFVKVCITFLIFFGVLLLYMWAYQHVSNSTIGQKLLPFAMTIGVFIMRKIMLALTDSFPLDVAMLVSGFWVENIYDMFQTMAYRSVKTPVNYITIWFTNAISLLANLFFLTEFWFGVRIWIKAYLPLAFRGQCCPYRLGIEPDDSEDDNERGHSNNKIGYHRRQIRFVMYKLFSKIIAALFYLFLGTILRYGLNKQLFPFASDSFKEYTNSLQFSVYNLIFLTVVGGLGGGFYVRTRYRSLFDHFVESRHTIKSRFMIGGIVALLIHNGIVAISMMMYFNQIYYVVHDDDGH